MKVFTTETSDIAAFKALTMNRDWNKGDIILGENGGLTCVNHHKWQFWNNGHTVSAQENADIRSVFSNALNDAYGENLRTIYKHQPGNRRVEEILLRIRDKEFGRAGETGLSRATVKATIEEIEALISRNKGLLSPQAIRNDVAGQPLQELLGGEFNSLLGLTKKGDDGQVVDVFKEKPFEKENLLRRAGKMVSVLLKTRVVLGEVDGHAVINKDARKSAIEGNCRFFATFLLRLMRDFPDFIDLLKEHKNGNSDNEVIRQTPDDPNDDEEPEYYFSKLVKLIDAKYTGKNWTGEFKGSGVTMNNPGFFASALFENCVIRTGRMLAVVKKADSYENFVSGREIGNDNGKKMFENLFANGSTGEFMKYDVNRLNEFFRIYDEQKAAEKANENKVK